jgi:hypothetical protein
MALLKGKGKMASFAQKGTVGEDWPVFVDEEGSFGSCTAKPDDELEVVCGVLKESETEVWRA